MLLATGASYRRLGLPALEALNGAGVFYGGPSSEAPAMAGRDVYVLGGANSAGQAALYLARYARRVTLVVRAASLDAGMSHYLVREIEATRNPGPPANEIVDGGGDGWLEHLVLRDRRPGGTVEADGLFVMIGARPRTEWLPPEVDRDAEGFVLTGADLTGSRPGRWSAHRSCSRRACPGCSPRATSGTAPGRVAASVGEGAVAIQLLHQLFAADQRQPRSSKPLALLGRPAEPAADRSGYRSAASQSGAI